ncbi:NAD-dependent epimerase/dehydratase family protein [Sphingobacterium sp. LRF_L2]|uniref:NAD-dependent epimerase/dehydratase family protein n=1 Tax=Sphingobacterium sp. LRF_L2 TaxID=3369421 RepID=UPI003F637346
MVALILGCGWIGEAFAKRLLEQGYTVYATTTKEDKYQHLSELGICPILADFDKAVRYADFPAQVDILLNSIPAVKRLEEQVLIQRFDSVHRLISRLAYKKHLFLSSIGVYPDQDGSFAENFVLDRMDNLQCAENKMLTLERTLVFRLGGLFGEQRIFAKYFQNRICTTGAQLANFIHQEDVLALIELGFHHTLKSPIYNLVTPEHPLKRDVILASAQKYGYFLPSSFEDNENFQKIVISDKIQQELNYSFLFKSPLEF